MNYIYLFPILGIIISYCYSTSDKFKYYTKYIIYSFVCIVVSIIVLIVSIGRPRNVKNAMLSCILGQVASPLIGIEWEINGSENVPKDEACIIMANHQSALDILGMFHLWPYFRSATAVAKKELVYFVPFGPCLYASGLLLIPRSQSEKSKKILNDAVEVFKKENTHIWLFPEGTRRSDGQIHEFKKGGFHMALSAHLPILPVVYGAYDFINHKEKRFDSGKQVINILPPISTKGKSIEDLDALIKETRSKMIENYNEINNTKLNL